MKEIGFIEAESFEKTATQSEIKTQEQEQIKYEGLAAVIRDRYELSKRHKDPTEKRWGAAYANYRGEYGADILAKIDPDKSHIFVKITKTKVLAAYGQIIEVLLANNKFPIGIENSMVPEGIEEFAHIDPNTPPEEAAPPPQDRYGYAGDGMELPAGATVNTLKLGDLQEKYGEAGFKPGPSPDLTTMPQISPAKEAAYNMEKIIHDQLDSTSAITVLKSAVMEMCMLGTGIIKGPFTINKTIHNWIKGDNGRPKYEPYPVKAPRIESVSVWDSFPDPAARCHEEMEWHVERHRYNYMQMRDLMNQPLFNIPAIEKAISEGPNYIAEDYETILTDNPGTEALEDRFEVLEYWGIIDKHVAEMAGLEVPDEMSEMTQMPINCWVCGGNILRLIANPFVPARIPYFICPYELHPYQLFGVGVAENMEDSQIAMNGIARMTIDNLNFSGNVVLDVDESSLIAGQEYKFYPGKIFRRQMGAQGPGIHAIEIPNVTNQSMLVFDKFRMLSDEQTGIPSYSHGQTGVSGVGRTSSGISMLLGAAALNIKTVVKNIDDYLLAPMGEAMFSWNMQFNEDEDLPIRGDLEVKARGTSALMQKEVRSQRLMTFLQLSSNPQLAPLVKHTTLLKEIAKTLDLQPEEIINDPESAAIYARIVGLQRGGAEGLGTGGGQPAGMDPNAQLAAGANPGGGPSPSGGAIGTGSVPTPGEAAFSAAGG